MIESIKTLKHYISSESEYLSRLLKQPEKEKYHTFYIKRKNGKKRYITAPSYRLKNVQQKIASKLQKIYSFRHSVHGYLPNRSIITNALPHIKKEFVINVDLKNFFESIKREKIETLFYAKPFNFINGDLNLICDICTFDNHLPLGAPTSPILSNFICITLDDSLSKFCDIHKINFTRYADDLTFSANFDVRKTNLIEHIFTMIECNGFEVNEDKFRVCSKTTRQEVTGLIVNTQLNVKLSYLKNIRAILHNWEHYGITKTSKLYERQYYKSKLCGTPNFMNSILGKIEFVGMVRGKQDNYYQKLLNKFNYLCQFKSEPDIVDLTDDNGSFHLKF